MRIRRACSCVIFRSLFMPGSIGALCVSKFSDFRGVVPLPLGGQGRPRDKGRGVTVPHPRKARMPTRECHASRISY